MTESSNEETERSFHPLTTADLHRMNRLVSKAHSDLSERRRDLKGRLLAGCLAQGGGLHFVDPSHGLKDIDLWLFYRSEGLAVGIPSRSRWTYDFGPSEHGRHPEDDPGTFLGRRVDVMVRGVHGRHNTPAEAVRTWLTTGTTSARLLKEKPLVLVWPKSLVGEIVHTPTDHSDANRYRS